MAWEHYMAVHNSDLYDGQGLAKCLLARIGMLIIGPPEADSNEAPDPDEGWCIATQAYLAAQLGCSESFVLRWVEQMFQDGWLVIEEYRDKKGHKRLRYAMDVDAIKERKMQRGTDGEYIRKKNPRRKNPKSFTATSREEISSTCNTTVTSSQLVAVEPHGYELVGLTATSYIPHGWEPSSEGFSSLSESMSDSSEKSVTSVPQKTVSTKTVETKSNPASKRIPNGKRCDNCRWSGYSDCYCDSVREVSA